MKATTGKRMTHTVRTTRVLRERHCAAGVVATFVTAAIALGQTEVVIRTGEPAPDGNGTFASFLNDPIWPDDYAAYGPALNDAGQIVVPGFLTDTARGSDDDSGLYLIDGTGVLQLAREGQTPPDGDGVFNRFTGQSEAALAPDGVVAFAAYTRLNQSGEYFETGIYVRDDESLIQLLRAGDPAPGGGGTMHGVFDPCMNGNGMIAFAGELEAFDPLGKRALFRGHVASGEMTLLVRDGSPTPEGNGSFDLIAGSAINDAGQVVFSSSLHAGFYDDRGIYRAELEGGLTRIVRRGDPSPDSNETFNSFTSAARECINSSGQVAFAASMSDSGGQYLDSSAGIWRFGSGTITPIARTGQAGPGQSTFVGFGSRGGGSVALGFNDAGQVCFFGEIEDDGYVYRGIFRGDGAPGGMTEIVREGQPAPDGNGTFYMFSDPRGQDSRDIPKMNEQGQLAIFTNLRDTARGPMDDEGIFFYDDDQGLLTVAREGDAFLQSTITDLRFTPRGSLGQDNGHSGLNNEGQVAYAFELADGSGGVAIWTPPTDFGVGDVNCDGAVDAFDIEPFVLALTDPAEYGRRFPDCRVELCDINGDGAVDAFDIAPFIDMLS